MSTAHCAVIAYPRTMLPHAWPIPTKLCRCRVGSNTQGCAISGVVRTSANVFPTRIVSTMQVIVSYCCFLSVPLTTGRRTRSPRRRSSAGRRSTACRCTGTAASLKDYAFIKLLSTLNDATVVSRRPRWMLCFAASHEGLGRKGHCRSVKGTPKRIRCKGGRCWKYFKQIIMDYIFPSLNIYRETGPFPAQLETLRLSPRFPFRAFPRIHLN